MTDYSDLIGNERDRNAGFRTVPLPPSFEYKSEYGVIVYLADYANEAWFTEEHGVITKYTPWWPGNQRIEEKFLTSSALPRGQTEHGMVIGFPCWWHKHRLLSNIS